MSQLGNLAGNDSRGSFGRNLALSRNRAQAVAAELRKHNVSSGG